MILIVDDHPDLGRGIIILLREAGYEAALAASGEEALALIPTLPPRLVLVDQNMPGMKGINVLRHLRGHPQPGLRDTPVIMHSAGVDAASEEEARRIGVSAYLLKGGDEWDDLLSLVERHAAEPVAPDVRHAGRV